MKPPRDNAYIGVVTGNFRAAADFYIQHFAYTPVAEMDDFVSVRSPNGKRCLGFSAAPNVIAEETKGVRLSFLVESAEEALSHFQAAGVPITRGIESGGWGAKHFIVTDPAGLELYISEQTTETNRSPQPDCAETNRTSEPTVST